MCRTCRKKWKTFSFLPFVVCTHFENANNLFDAELPLIKSDTHINENKEEIMDCDFYGKQNCNNKFVSFERESGESAAATEWGKFSMVKFEFFPFSLSRFVDPQVHFNFGEQENERKIKQEEMAKFVFMTSLLRYFHENFSLRIASPSLLLNWIIGKFFLFLPLWNGFGIGSCLRYGNFIFFIFFHCCCWCCCGISFVRVTRKEKFFFTFFLAHWFWLAIWDCVLSVLILKIQICDKC